MITQLASPSVCVIDDEMEDYRYILAALNELYVSSVHILGNDIEQLPPTPFTRLQLVFLDLHLTNSVGKDAASHTANIFRKVVSADTAPVIVVIWSKYADDRVPEDGVPPEDQETQSQLFKRTLFEAEPRFRNRLIFLEMEKPKQGRPENWSKQLKQQIEMTVGQLPATSLLWSWDGLVKNASAALTASLTTLAEESATSSDSKLTDDDLKEVLQRLARAQGEGDLSPATALGHLVTILAQLLMDQLEHADSRAELVSPGVWLSQTPGSKTKASVAARMNGFLLTAGPADGAIPFVPGTVYRADDPQKFLEIFGLDQALLETTFCKTKREVDAAKVDEWNQAVRPIVVEISPACDIANNKRYNAHLIGGLIVPAAKRNQIVSDHDAWTIIPIGSSLSLRWPLLDFDVDNVLIVLCHRLKASIGAQTLPTWLIPWFRLRELPTTSIRNLHMAQASRVGYVSL